MKKLIIILLTIIFLIIAIFLIVKNIKNENVEISNNQNPNSSSKIVIIKYKLGTSDEIKRIQINSEKEIEKFNKYIKELKPLSDEEKTKTAYIQEILIKYNDSETIATQLNSRHCLYTNSEKNIQYMSNMSTEFSNWIEEKIK